MNDTNIGKLSKKKRNRKSKKVTDLKTNELDENATERKCTQIVNVNFGSNSTFHLNLIASSFSLSKSYKEAKLYPLPNLKLRRRHLLNI